VNAKFNSEIRHRDAERFGHDHRDHRHWGVGSVIARQLTSGGETMLSTAPLSASCANNQSMPKDDVARSASLHESKVLR